MAKVQRYDRIVNANEVQESMVNMAGGEARAVGQIANTVTDVGMELDKRIKDAQATTWITQASVDLRKRMQQRELDLQQQYGENPEGYSAELEKSFYQESEGLVKGAPNVMATRAWTQMSGQYAQKITDSGLSWERNRKIENYTIGLDKSLQDLATVAYRDRNPGNWQGYVDQIDSAMEGAKTLLSPAQIEEVRKNAMSSLSSNFFNGVYEQNPRAARALIDSKALDGKVDPSKLASMRERADNEIKRQNREAEQSRTLARMEARSQATDIEAALRAGGDIDVPDEVLAVMKPDERKQWSERISAARKYGADATAVSYASPDEIQEILSERESRMMSGDITGFKIQAQDLSDLSGILAKRQDALMKDPAGYAARSPAMRAASEELQAVGDDPTLQAAATQRYVQALKEEQMRLGVPRSMVKAIPSGQAAALAQQISSIEEPGQVTAAMTQLQQQYGAAWPEVSAMAFGSKNSPVSNGIKVASFFGPGTPEADRIVKVAKDFPTLKKSFAESELSGLKKSIADVTTPLRQTFLEQNGGSEAFNTLSEGVEMLAVSYMAQGDSPETAAQKANNSLNKQYTINGSYRVRNDSGLAPDAIQRNLTRLQEGISLAAYEKPIVPGVGKIDDRYIESAERALRNKGRFVTNHDESGVNLLFPDGQPLRDKSGDPVTFSFKDMSDGAILTAEENEKFGYVIQQIRNDPKRGVMPGGIIGVMDQLQKDRGLLESYYQQYKSREPK